MSQGTTIAKLEALLARVKSRAGMPRTAAVRAEPVVTATRTRDTDGEPVTREVDLAASRLPAVEVPPIVELDVELDVALVAPEPVVAAVEDAVAGVSLESESRERLVAAEPAASEPQVAIAEIVLDEPGEPELGPELLAEPSDVEDAPASSRRPVAPQPEERIAEIAFGAEEPQPARHTPPPESGRLPSAQAVEYDSDVTGVHETGTTAAIVPEATVAELAPSEAVADVVGAVREVAPQTFVALLDASMAL